MIMFEDNDKTLTNTFYFWRYMKQLKMYLL